MAFKHTESELVGLEVTSETKDEKSRWQRLNAKAAALGKRLIGVTESTLLPDEVERMSQMQSQVDVKLSELYRKANSERRSGDSYMEVDIIEFRWKDFTSFVRDMKKKFPEDLELWENMNVYLNKLDDYRGANKFTDSRFLKQLQAVGSKKLPLLKYSFIALVNLGDNYAHHFLTHAEQFGSPAVFPQVYQLMMDYVAKEKGVIHVEALNSYIRKHLNSQAYR